MNDRRTDTAGVAPASGLRAILVVRDPQGARDLHDVISRYGFSVAVNADPGTALTSCQEKPPALALVDHELPSDSGIAFLRALLKVSWTTATILITSEDHEQVHAVAEGLGILGQIRDYHDLDGVKMLIDKFLELAGHTHVSHV